MKNILTISVLLILSICKLNAQIFCNTPKNINQAIEQLDRSFTEKEKVMISKIPADSLLIRYKESESEFEIMDDWFITITRRSTSKDGRLGKYYKKKGLETPYDMIEVVLRTYQSSIKFNRLNHDLILEPFQVSQSKYNNEDEIRLTTDSLRGVYIPVDLEDCFKELDKIYTDSIKLEIAKLTQKEYTSRDHLFGIGVWVRNNWQLWGGSRLSVYFNQLGVNHPDDMSGIIMNSYNRYLRNEEIELAHQVNYYKEYWDKANREY